MRLFALVLALASLFVASVHAAQPPATPPGFDASRDKSQAVFHDGRKQALEYVGPGRDDPEPADLAEVRIGYFGPNDPSHIEFGDLWSAAQIAIDQANGEKGCRGKPFRLVARWSDQPWTGGAAQAARLVYEDKVWAIVGGPDSATTHLAEQIAAKARLPIVSPVSTDRSTNAAFVPWIFSCLPGDDVLAPLLVARLAAIGAQDAFVILAADDHDSRAFLAQLTVAMRAKGIAPRRRFVFASASGNPEPSVEKTVRQEPRAVVVLAAAPTAARIVARLRGLGYPGPILGGPWMGRRLFAEKSGVAPGDLAFPGLYVPAENPTPFAAHILRRIGKPPDYAAAAAFDAVSLVVAAIRQAGLNRARIADAIRALAPWQGECGPIRWDALGGNPRAVPLATIRNGAVVALP